MTQEEKNKVLGFTIYNQYTKDNAIIWIALDLCQTYGWPTNEIAYYTRTFDPIEHCEYTNVVHNENKAWEYTLKAAREHKDVYAIATVLFLKKYPPVIEEVGYHVTNESILIEMIEILESIEEKDELVNFVLGRAYFSGRGAELDFDKVLFYFDQAAKGGIEIARLFYFEVAGEFEAIFRVAEKLIVKYPDSHIIKFYLALCYYHGCGTETNYEKVVELVGYTGEIQTYNEDPVDYYFLASRYLLGLCYFHGYAVEKNLPQAEHLFRFSAARYNMEAWYCQAITSLLSDKDHNPKYIWDLLHKSAAQGYLPAVRKVMLCLRKGYGTEPDKEYYIQYADYFDHEKEEGITVSELGYEADHCALIDYDHNVIEDDEID